MNRMNGNSSELDIKMLRIKQPIAIEHWYLKYADDLYTFIFYRIGKNHELAADLVEDTYMNALRNIERYDPKRGTMLTWLRLLSKNCIKKALKEKDRYSTYECYWQELDDKLTAGYKRFSDEPLPDEILEKNEVTELIQMALSNLPSNYKYILEEYYYHQKSLKTIAAFLSIKENAAKALLHRARIAFKTAFCTFTRSQLNPFIGKRSL